MMQRSRGIGRWVADRRREFWHLRNKGLPGLQEHIRRRGVQRVSSFLGVDGSIPEWESPRRSPRRPLRVGIIADDFTRLALAYEWEQVVLKPKSWRQQLQAQPIDLLFVESAWNGNEGAWQYHLTGNSAPRPAVVELIAWCRENLITSVFWNKEDPAHFEDFLDVARLTDWVFTTDIDCIEQYRDRLGHDRVGLMAFGVQDILCNPTYAGPGMHAKGVAFAGTYFAHKYPERREQMEILFDAAIAAETPEHSFDIYSRFLRGDERYQFPEPYADHVVGSLNYARMLSAYRAYKVFLNVNSITESQTMCARRVLEITACGAAVVTTPARAISWYVGDGAVQVSDRSQAVAAIAEFTQSDAARERLTHIGQRKLWQDHTFSRRVDDLLTTVGLGEHARRSASASAIISTRRAEQFDHVVNYLAAQQGIEVQALLAAHGWHPTPDQLAVARERGVNLEVVNVAEEWTLGECLNALKKRADGDLVAKMDDDDLYGPHYLFDLWAAREFSNADVIGKSQRYVYLEGSDQTLLVPGWGAHRFTPFVVGPTLSMSREIARQVQFQPRSTGEDTQFLKDAAAAGASIYASDPFNFVQWRRADKAHHTWQVEDSEFAKATEKAQGLIVNNIMI